MLRFGFFVTPHVGGPFSVYRQLRSGLDRYGVELRWIGPADRELISDQKWADEFTKGVAIESRAAHDQRRQARDIISTIGSEGLDGVFVNVLTDRVSTNVARYLPAEILRIMVVHSITPGTYAAARAIKYHVHATVGVSERCRRDLVGRCGFPPSRTIAIANAVGVVEDRVSAAPSPRNGLKVLFVGRIEEGSKGVLWLPKIIRSLPEEITLTIAGDGPDLSRLRAALADLRSRVRLLGSVQPEGVADLLSSHDALIMPSRWEGMPMSLVEAMAAGCVPVASRISGVTDSVVEHGRDGLLFPVGAWQQAASHLLELRDDPRKLRALSEAARLKARASFSQERMAASYMQLIERLRQDPPEIAPPLPLREWHIPRGLRTSLRSYVPEPIKNALRVVRENAQSARAKRRTIVVGEANEA